MQVLTAPLVREERDVASVLECIDVDSGARTTLAEFDYLVEAPNWTHDGQALVYNSKGRILRFDLGTRQSREIPTAFATSCNNDHVLSPDGRLIAISHRTAEDGLSRIYTLPLSGGDPTLVTPIAPSFLHGWSPDGRTLAYCGERNGDWDIYAIAALGGNETRLTSNAGRNDGPEYSPDGRSIWFNSTRSGLMQIWRMDRDGSGQTQVTGDESSNSWFPHLSPDGRRVVYIAYRRGDVEPEAHPANKDVELRLISADGGPSRTIAKLLGGQGTINVNSWSPDSRTLAFVSYRLKG
jgi:TolB protein